MIVVSALSSITHQVALHVQAFSLIQNVTDMAAALAQTTHHPVVVIMAGKVTLARNVPKICVTVMVSAAMAVGILPTGPASAKLGSPVPHALLAKAIIIIGLNVQLAREQAKIMSVAVMASATAIP